MTTKQWYRAHLRWAVMVEGKEGLRGWKESVYLFLVKTTIRHSGELSRSDETIRTNIKKDADG